MRAIKIHLQACYRKICIRTMMGALHRPAVKVGLPLMLLVLLLALSSWKPREQAAIPASLKWSEQMEFSIAERGPEAYPNWGYTQGLVLYAFE